MVTLPQQRRILDHPILGRLPDTQECTIVVDGKPLPARPGEPILAALLAAGIKTTHTTDRFSQPRGLFCGIGLCSDCLITVNGQPGIPSCITPVKDGMCIETSRSTR